MKGEEDGVCFFDDTGATESDTRDLHELFRCVLRSMVEHNHAE